MSYRRLRLYAVLLCMLFGGIGPSVGFAQTSPDTQLLYELLNRLEQLEQELRQVRGDLEMYKYHQGEGGGNAYADLERRVQALEARLGTNPNALAPEPSATSEPASPNAPSESPLYPPLSQEPVITTVPDQAPTQAPIVDTRQVPAATATEEEQAAYDAAISDLRAGQYAQAITKFESFTADFPSSPLLSDAEYWLGEAYYVNRDFEQAREIFLTLGSQYPDSDKIPNTLLKLGYIYESLGDREKARQVYRKLLEAYSHDRNAALAEQRLRAIR